MEFRLSESSPNKLVVAFNGLDGVILSWSGPDLSAWFATASATVMLSDIGLDSAPVGVSVWEGEVTIDGGEQIEFHGDFRALTEEEWEDLRKAGS